MKRLNIQEIPQNAKIALYGAGGSGRKARAILEFVRPDLDVVFFLDSFKSFEFDGLPCHQVATIDTLTDGFDLIVVASAYYIDIATTLKGRGIHNFFIMDVDYFSLNFSTKAELVDLSGEIESISTRAAFGSVDIFSELVDSLEKDRVLLQKQMVEGLCPRGAMVQISKKCNYRCVFCGSSSWKDNSGFMDFDLFKLVVSELNKIRATLTLVGPQGEPTLHPKFTELILYAGENCKSDVYFCTNGSGLTKKKIHALIESGIKNIKISFAGYDKKSYERVYIGGNFENVVKNMVYLSDLISKVGHDIKFDIFGIYPGSCEEEKTYDEFVHACKKFYREIGLIGNYTFTDMPHNFAGNAKPGSYDERVGVFTAKKIYEKRKPLCSHLFNPSIQHDGLVTSCGCLDANRTMLIGDIREQSLIEIMRGEKLQRLVWAYVNRDYSVLPMCRKCDFPYSHES